MLLTRACATCGAPLSGVHVAAHQRLCARLERRAVLLQVPSPPPSPPRAPTRAADGADAASLQRFLEANALLQHAHVLRERRVLSLRALRALSRDSLSALPLPLGAKRRLFNALDQQRAPPLSTKRPPPTERAPSRDAKRARAAKSPPPFSHRVADTAFVVDAFRYKLDDGAVTFLTHYHSDHYMGLPKSLPKRSSLYCTPVTAALVKRFLRVPPHNVHCLHLQTRYSVRDAAGKQAHVWLFDANHCPGAAIVLFFVLHTKKWVLHTGDFRYSAPHFDRFHLLKQLVQTASLHYLHLDTTYCSPAYAFPPQHAVLDVALQHARQEDARTKGACLFFFGTYSIGKEKVFLHIATHLNLHIYASKRKRETLSLLNMPQITSRLVDDPRRARIHLVPMGDLKPESLRKYVKFNRLSDKFIGRGLAVCFRPTGWTFSGLPVRRQLRAADNAVVFQLAYSEHSSFEELRRFVEWVSPCRLIPMVGAYNAEKRQQMSTLLAHKDRPLSQDVFFPPT